MISGEQIGSLIKHPFDVRKNQLDDIQQLIGKYPYCSSLYLLKVIGLSLSKSIELESFLTLTAPNIPDREQLFHLLNEAEGQFIEEDEEENDVVTEVSDTVSVESETSVIEEEFDEEEIDDNVVSIQEEAEAVLVSAEKEIAEEREEIELASLDSEILSHAVSEAFIIEDDREEKISVKPEKDVIEEAAPKQQQTTTILRPENMTFIEWLKYKQQTISVPEKEKTVKSEKLKTTIGKSAMSKKEINDLLDRFIEEEPSISAVNKEFFDPTSNAKKSVEESVDIVSETLAKIHVMQGNYSKAISAYKQLSLLYPEKKAFFADQIEKIKEKRNN